MPRVDVLRLDPEGSETPEFGEHIWISLEFSSGVFINVRVDEFENSRTGQYNSVLRLKKGRGAGFTHEKEIKI